MPDGVLGEFFPIIRAFAVRGIPSTVLWDMELWEIAAALGIGEPPSDPTMAMAGQPPPPTSPTRDLLAERLAHARGEAPEPQPDAPTVFRGRVLTS